MAIVSCTSCGAQVDDASRFCRSCGKPFDPSELTTRKLEPDIQYQSPTQIVNQSPTTPAYLSPAPLPAVPAVPATNDLTPKSQNRTAIIILAATVGLLLFLLCAVMFVKFNNGSTALAPPVGGIPTVPTPPVAPPPPVVPAISGAVELESLIYPGSERVMTINSQGKGVVQLRTTDRIDKVIAWYTNRLKPTKIVNLPGGSAVLKSGDAAVVIAIGEDEISITVSRGGGDD